MSNSGVQPAQACTLPKKTWRTRPSVLLLAGLLFSAPGQTACIQPLPESCNLECGLLGALIQTAAATGGIVPDGGVLVDFLPNLTTNEMGAMAEFSIELLEQPTADVIIPLESGDLSEGTLIPVSLTFTPDDWDIPQTIEITGINDAILDGNTAYIIRTRPIQSADPRFNGLDPVDITVTNQDDDIPNVLIAQSDGATRLTEGGASDDYTVVLSSQPTAPVTVTVTPDAQATVNASAAPINLNFTAGACPGPGNWCAPQTVAVRAVDDAADEGSHRALIAHSVASADASYAGLSAPGVESAILDNDGTLRVFLTKGRHNGAFDTDASLAGGGAAAVTGDGNGIDEADNFCDQDRANPARNTGSFRALLVDPANRVASATANAGDGQVAWVLQASRRYGKGKRLRRVFDSDTNAIFVFGQLRRSPGGGRGRYWTGLNPDWTSGPEHCTNWSVGTGGANRGMRGRANARDSVAITDSSSNNRCNRNSRLLCVQQ